MLDFLGSILVFLIKIFLICVLILFLYVLGSAIKYIVDDINIHDKDNYIRKHDKKIIAVPTFIFHKIQKYVEKTIFLCEMILKKVKKKFWKH